MMGPVRRAIMGNFIFWNNVAWSNIPGLSILTSIIFGYWGVADYYDYNFDYDRNCDHTVFSTEREHNSVCLKGLFLM